MILYLECPMCGKNTIVSVREDAYREWKAGTLIQNAFSNLTPKARELIKNSYCYKCQGILFGMEG